MTETEETGEKEEAVKFGKTPDASFESIEKALEGDPAEIPLRLF